MIFFMLRFQCGFIRVEKNQRTGDDRGKVRGGCLFCWYWWNY